MSLQDLKSWDFSTGSSTTRDRTSLPPALREKQISAVENLKQPVPEISSKPSVRTHRATSSSHANKENK